MKNLLLPFIIILLFSSTSFLAAQNVGIGTTTPETPLSILGNGATQPVGITQNQVGGTATMELTTEDISGNQATRLLLRGAGNEVDIEFYSGASGSELEIMHLEGTNGNVGIGTTSPNAKLQVNGDIRLGTSGQLFATGGQENLRIIRGFIDINGNVGSGTGFTVTQVGPGGYQIVYSTPFNSNDIPVVMVTPNFYTVNQTVLNSTPSSFNLTLQLAANQQPSPFPGSFFFVVYGVD